MFTVVPAELSTILAVHRRDRSNRDRTTGHINVGRPLQNPVNEPCQNPDIKMTTAQGVLPWRRGWVSWWRYNVGDLAVLDTCALLDTVLTRFTWIHTNVRDMNGGPRRDRERVARHGERVRLSRHS